MDFITVTVRGTVLFEGREGPRKQKYEIPPGWKIWDLVDHLDHLSSGRLKENLFDRSAKFKKGVRIFLNGKDVRFLEETELVLNEGDVVLFLPLLAGG